MRPSIALAWLILPALAAPGAAAARGAPSCALWWEPGAPVAIWPHETAPPETRLEAGPADALT
ncbi:MAG TPA: hypothetical protein VJP59_11650, partial [Gemmatimonadota bacterium]|nr:hypothetical protein [Gemmatimonadota bacterium]